MSPPTSAEAQLLSLPASLNPENELGSPVSLTVDTGGATGNMIRIKRTPDPDLSGSGGAGNSDESAVLSLDTVTADGILGGGGAGQLTITEFSLDEATGMISLTWASRQNPHLLGSLWTGPD